MNRTENLRGGGGRACRRNIALNNKSLLLSSGLYFQLDPTTANHELDISADQCTVALKSPMYTFILGNVKLTTGCHYWRVHVDVFNSPNQLSIIGK
jgi:tripartite motif-containing protein 9/67